MKNIVSYTFTSLWIIALAMALYVSRNWNSTTALFPQSVGIPMLALLVVILVLDIRKGRRQKEKEDAVDECGQDFPTRNRAMVLYLSWLVGFAVVVWAIGLIYTIPIYIFSYMTLQGKFGWLKSAIYAAAATAFIFLLFQYAFHVAWPEGELLMMFNAGN